MIHHAACIGIFVIHADWPVERLRYHAKILTQSGKLRLRRLPIWRLTGINCLSEAIGLFVFGNLCLPSLFNIYLIRRAQYVRAARVEVHAQTKGYAETMMYCAWRGAAMAEIQAHIRATP